MSRKIVFSGGLRFLSLADIFQMIGGNNSTGRLKLKGPQHLPVGYIYFSSGNPVNAVHGELHGIEAINAMFGWTEGDFEFYEEEISVEHSIKTGRMKIVLDALRLLDEGVIKIIGTPGASPIHGYRNHPSGNNTAVIKGPPVNYVYLIDEEKYYKAFLTDMIGSSDVFDLKIRNLDDDQTAYLEFDHIIDAPEFYDEFDFGFTGIVRPEQTENWRYIPTGRTV